MATVAMSAGISVCSLTRKETTPSRPLHGARDNNLLVNIKNKSINVAAAQHVLGHGKMCSQYFGWFCNWSWLYIR